MRSGLVAGACVVGVPGGRPRPWASFANSPAPSAQTLRIRVSLAIVLALMTSLPLRRATRSYREHAPQPRLRQGNPFALLLDTEVRPQRRIDGSPLASNLHAHLSEEGLEFRLVLATLLLALESDEEGLPSEAHLEELLARAQPREVELRSFVRQHRAHVARTGPQGLEQHDRSRARTRGRLSGDPCRPADSLHALAGDEARDGRRHRPGRRAVVSSRHAHLVLPRLLVSPGGPCGRWRREYDARVTSGAGLRGRR